MDELEQAMARESARQDAEAGTTTTTDTATTQTADTTATTAPIETATTQTNDTANTDAAVVATVADQNTTTTAPVVNDNPNDFIANLERISGGTIKTQEDFIAALEKAKKVDTLEPTLAELQAKLAVNPYADEYEQKRNELKKAGASKEQIKAFEQINELGDLSELSSKEAKIMKMVLVDGLGEKVARLKVEKEFSFKDQGGEELEGDDLEIAQSDLDQSAKPDRVALEAYKATASFAPVSDVPLVDAAAKAKYESELKPVLEGFARDYSSITNLNLNGKEGDEAVNLDLKVSEDDKTGMITDIRDFLTGNNLPLTQENYDEALSFARANVITKNLGKITQEVWQKADAHFTKYFTEKYENTGGIPKGDQAPKNQVNEDEAAHRAWKDDLLGKTRKN